MYQVYRVSIVTVVEADSEEEARRLGVDAIVDGTDAPSCVRVEGPFDPELFVFPEKKNAAGDRTSPAAQEVSRVSGRAS